MRIMRVICRLALPAGVLLCCLNGAGAQGSVDVRQACTPDAMRLCSEFIPDPEKVKTCMLSKRSQLSEQCRTAMVASRGRVATSHHVERRHVERHHRGRSHCVRHGRHCR